MKKTRPRIFPVRFGRRLLRRWAVRLGRTVFGVVPHARRIRAANDPRM